MTNEKQIVSPTANRRLTITRLVNARVEQVWEVWTNPDHIKK